MTLLEKAIKKVDHRGRRPKRYGIDRVELAVAYLNGDIDSGQVARALGQRASNAPQAMALTLRSAILNGQVKKIELK